jgi:peptidoglycan-associated lipoprotein
MDIWVSENRSYPNRMKFPQWSPPENFEELNTPSFEGMFSILFSPTDDRPEEIYFTSLASEFRDGYKGLNIYLSTRIPGSKNWMRPIHLNEINSNFNDRMPAISPDGKILIFSSDRPGGFGGFDLWVSFRFDKNSKWSEPINMGPGVNSVSNEIAPSFHWDGETLYFSSDRGSSDKKYRFFLTNWKEESFCRMENGLRKSLPYNPNCWTSPQELGFPFNTQIFQPETSIGAFDRYDPAIPLADYRNSDNEGISISHDDLWVYFGSNRPGGKGQFDIYRAPMSPELRKSYEFLFSGLVLDGSEPEMIGIESTIKILDEENNSRVITSARIGGDLKPASPDGKVENFATKLQTGRFYRVMVSAPGFYPTELELDLRGNIGKGKSRYERIVLKKIEPSREKKNFITFQVLDKKSGDPVPDSKLTLFTQENRAGATVGKEKDVFLIKDLPKEDFEILAKAPGYKDDTYFYKIADLEDISSETQIIYLTKLSDIDEVYGIIVYFPFNVREINDNDRKNLNRLAEYMKAHPEDILEVGGHTDNVASKEYNIQLSRSRAQSVYDYLKSRGVPEERMKIKAYYYSQPAEDNSTESGRAKNRRVNFKKLN